MKIAITFKKDDSQLVFDLHTLKIRGFEIGETSDKYTYWVYNLKTVQFFRNLNCIQIEKSNFETHKIYLSNVEYFEIHKED